MADKTCLSKGWVDNTTTAVLYPTDVKTHVLNIDSRFRDHSQSVSSTDFMIKLPRTYKNVIGVRLSSIEIPNTWYTFTCARGNTAIKVNNIVSYISDGNYTPTQLASNVQSTVQTAAGNANTAVAFSSVTGKITSSNATNGLSLEFGTAPSCGDCLSAASSLIPYNGGLGYQLGFTGTSYGGNSTFTGEYIVDTMRDTYVLLQLPELEMLMDSFTYGNTSIKAFAKIIIDQDKYILIYDNGANTVSKQIQFPQPVNMSTFRVRLVDAYGLPIDLMADFSITLEISEVVNSKTYEAYRNSLTC